MTLPSLSISESAGTQFFIADFWIDNDTVWPLISESTISQCLATDF
jgi:hypothetical protein